MTPTILHMILKLVSVYCLGMLAANLTHEHTKRHARIATKTDKVPLIAMLSLIGLAILILGCWFVKDLTTSLS